MIFCHFSKGGDPNEKPNVQKHATYIKGVRMGSLCMALYSLSCSFYSFFMRHLINRFSKFSFQKKTN